MLARDFAYFLQGFFEITDPKTINEEQTKMIKNHLNLVFHHDIDKQYSKGDGSQEVHDGKPKPLSFPTSLNDLQKNHFTSGDNNKELMRC